MKKVLVCVICICLLLSIFAGCSSNSSNSDKASSSTNTSSSETSSSETDKVQETEVTKGTITQWTWMADWEKEMADLFNKKYPDVKVELVGATDYKTKLQATIASGSPLPDIIPLESGFQGTFMNMDLFEDLSQAPYNFDKSQAIDYLINQNINDKGELIGIPLMPCPAGLYYKRDLAKKYLGTDDTDAISKMYTDWNSFIELGKKVVQDSGGKVFAVAGLGDIWSAINGQNIKPYIDNGKVVVEQNYLDDFKLLKSARDAGIDGKMEQNTAAWNQSLSKGNVLFYPGAIWYIDYILKANDPNGSGNWGFVKAPGGGFSSGGTTYCINKKSAQKELAWKYIYTNYASLEGSLEKAKVKKDIPILKKAYEDPQINVAVEFLGNQIIAPTLLNIMNEMKTKNYSKYDGDISQAVGIEIKAMNSNAVTPEKAVEHITKNLEKVLQD